MAWTDESDRDGAWSDGSVWTIGEIGIWIGMANLFIGVGSSHKTGAYSDESAKDGEWSDE